MEKNKYYRKIPKVDLILESEKIAEAVKTFGKEAVLQVIHEVQEEIRKQIGQCVAEEQIEGMISNLEEDVLKRIEKSQKFHFKRVINGTGILLHTNLGRAPFSQDFAEELAKRITGYNNLEFNLETGKRGKRQSHFEEIVCRVTGAEAAIAVNNNAAAVLLILSALAKEKEVIVSRGELVEIGGKFRVPDVIEQGGAVLKEVGTTNRTRSEDYEAAITPETGALLKVHTSNYRILGFTESVTAQQLKELGEKYHIPVVEDLGSGVLIDLEQFGLKHEPTVQEVLERGADIVCFSGDKLLGGPQAGIIVGKKEYIEKMASHPLMRALRLDKIAIAALEQIFQKYLYEEKAIQEIPVFSMLKKSLDELEESGKLLIEMLKEKGIEKVELVDTVSMLGGGSLPLEEIPGKAVEISSKYCSAEEVRKELLQMEIPVVVRIVQEKILIDMRTVEKKELSVLAESLTDLFWRKHMGIEPIQDATNTQH